MMTVQFPALELATRSNCISSTQILHGFFLTIAFLCMTPWRGAEGSGIYLIRNDENCYFGPHTEIRQLCLRFAVFWINEVQARGGWERGSLALGAELIVETCSQTDPVGRSVGWLVCRMGLRMSSSHTRAAGEEIIHSRLALRCSWLFCQ